MAARLLDRVAAVAILAATAIDVAGLRWGAHIASPVPGLYLPDLLWVLGCALALPRVRTVRVPRPVVLAAATAAGYGLVRFAGAHGGDGVQSALLVRDLSPFAYLALVPLAALALNVVRARTWLWLLRLAPLVMAIGFALGAAGLRFDAIGGLLGGRELAAMPFPGRSDLLGVVAAVGVVAWGRYDAPTGGPAGVVAALLRPHRLAQVALAAVGLLAGSQAGQVAVAFALGWAVLREVWAVTPARAARVGAIVAICLAVTPIVLATTAVVVARPTTTPVKGPADVGTTGVTTAPTRDRVDYGPREVPDELGTIYARLSTWSAVVHAVGPTWATGTGLGRADTLLGACDLTLAEFAARPGANKCAVDSGTTPLPLRDPHDWALNLLLYQGVLGIAVFAGVVVAYWWRPSPDPVFSLTLVPAGLYALAAAVGVVFSSSFGLLPAAAFTAFALSRRAGGRVRSVDTL